MAKRKAKMKRIPIEHQWNGVDMELEMDATGKRLPGGIRISDLRKLAKEVNRQLGQDLKYRDLGHVTSLTRSLLLAGKGKRTRALTLLKRVFPRRYEFIAGMFREALAKWPHAITESHTEPIFRKDPHAEEDKHFEKLIAGLGKAVAGRKIPGVSYATVRNAFYAVLSMWGTTHKPREDAWVKAQALLVHKLLRATEARRTTILQLVLRRNDGAYKLFRDVMYWLAVNKPGITYRHIAPYSRDYFEKCSICRRPLLSVPLGMHTWDQHAVLQYRRETYDASHLKNPKLYIAGYTGERLRDFLIHTGMCRDEATAEAGLKPMSGEQADAERLKNNITKPPERPQKPPMDQQGKTLMEVFSQQEADHKAQQAQQPEVQQACCFCNQLFDGRRALLEHQADQHVVVQYDRNYLLDQSPRRGFTQAERRDMMILAGVCRSDAEKRVGLPSMTHSEATKARTTAGLLQRPPEVFVAQPPPRPPKEVVSETRHVVPTSLEALAIYPEVQRALIYAVGLPWQEYLAVAKTQNPAAVGMGPAPFAVGDRIAWKGREKMANVVPHVVQAVLGRVCVVQQTLVIEDGSEWERV